MKISDVTLDLFSGDLLEELEFRVECKVEDEDWVRDNPKMTKSDAVVEAVDDLYNLMEESKDWRNQRWMTAIRKNVMIPLGVYRVVTQEELDRTTIHTSSGVKKATPDFRMNGKMYEFDKWPKGWRGVY